MRKANLTWPQYCWKVEPMANMEEKPRTVSVMTWKGSPKGCISAAQRAQAEIPDR